MIPWSAALACSSSLPTWANLIVTVQKAFAWNPAYSTVWTFTLATNTTINWDEYLVNTENTTSFAANDKIKITITQIGSTLPWVNLRVYFVQ